MVLISPDAVYWQARGKGSTFIPWFCHTENPQGWEWHLAPSTNSALVQPFPVTAVVGALEWHYQGLPKSHLDVPKGPAGHSATCAAHAQDPCRDQSRTGSISLLLFSKAARGALPESGYQREQLQLLHTAKHSWSWSCPAPGQDGAGTQAGSLPCSQGKADGNCMEGSSCLSPFPAPATPNDTEQKSGSISEKRDWNEMVLKLRASQLLLPEFPIPAADLDAP